MIGLCDSFDSTQFSMFSYMWGLLCVLYVCWLAWILWFVRHDLLRRGMWRSAVGSQCLCLNSIS